MHEEETLRAYLCERGNHALVESTNTVLLKRLTEYIQCRSICLGVLGRALCLQPMTKLSRCVNDLGQRREPVNSFGMLQTDVLPRTDKTKWVDTSGTNTSTDGTTGQKHKNAGPFQTLFLASCSALLHAGLPAHVAKLESFEDTQIDRCVGENTHKGRSQASVEASNSSFLPHLPRHSSYA